jgi:DNA mismatch repair ATPase MutS
MKAFLMYRGGDFDLKRPLPTNAAALTQDLELDTLFDAMASGDKFLHEVAGSAILTGPGNDLDTIVYRQDILRDCLKNQSTIRDIYNIAVQAIEAEKKSYFGYFSKHPAGILHRSVAVLQTFATALEKLRMIADRSIGEFDSEGFKALLAMLQRELDDAYLAKVQDHLKQLNFGDGVLISAELGEGNKGDNYVLRRPSRPEQNWLERILASGPPTFTFRLHPRDESGARALSDLKDKGINLVANALAQSTDHILSFFSMLRTELGFYVGCLNLNFQLAQRHQPVSFPVASDASERRHCFRGLYDVCLALTTDRHVVGNDADADGRDLVIITGANTGGKSTFLRSIGLSQLMMQSGMFVPAQSFSSNICAGLFTHCKREEDASMKSGKLDEELGRMSEIVDRLTPDSMILFNESFAATNEREGSEIARQIVRALVEKRVKLFFVTHLYPFAHGLYESDREKTLFLRAGADRTFRLAEGEPLETSYGGDLYKQVFGEQDAKAHDGYNEKAQHEAASGAAG